MLKDEEPFFFTQLTPNEVEALIRFKLKTKHVGLFPKDNQEIADIFCRWFRLEKLEIIYLPDKKGFHVNQNDFVDCSNLKTSIEFLMNIVFHIHNCSHCFYRNECGEWVKNLNGH
jgi:uncharacterized protein YdhG (YjbR/CyaY superfamily)